jgi:hypothetical protein
MPADDSFSISLRLTTTKDRFVRSISSPWCREGQKNPNRPLHIFVPDCNCSAKTIVRFENVLIADLVCMAFFFLPTMGNQASRHETNVRVTDSRAPDHQYHNHHHHHHHNRQQPSGLSRSRSVRANMVTDDAARQQHSYHASSAGSGSSSAAGEPPSRYLPRGLDKAHNGIILPRMPYGAQVEPSSSNDGAGGGGVESPQWGWFLRTTPPTPQMYYPRTTASLQRHATVAAPGASHASIPPGGATTYDPASSGAGSGLPPPPPPPPASFGMNPPGIESTVLSASPRPNPIFQGLQDKHHAAPMGWSSVPL